MKQSFLSRINYKKQAILIASLIFLIHCNKTRSQVGSTKNVTVTYQAVEDDFANPERGFYRYTQTSVNNFAPLDLAQLKSWRTLQPVNGANYSVYSTLVFRYYVLEGYTSNLLPGGFLEKLKTDFSIAREAGVKLIARFTYTVQANAGNCPEAFACPPYGDASKSIVLQHIGQLKPALQQNADVIAVLQMGFIGIWGENYYTDHFGDPSSNGQGKLMNNNWTDRSEILKALLDAMPADRMVQVRIPQMKQRFVYGINASTSVPALTEAEAFSHADKARIGFHNDCFLASEDDYGTFADYGNSSSPRQSANDILRSYAKEDSRYVAMGGETCDDTFSPQNDCETSGRAQTEMRNMHYSYLNCAYNNAVNDDWQTGGCMDNIKKELGYRFVLKEGTYPSAIKAGEALKFVINLENVGYTSPYNERPAKLILRKQSSSEIFSFDINTDVRKWYSGSIKLESSITTSASMPEGRYELLLFLPDKYASIANRPEYAIRIANKDMWESSTGYNKLAATVDVR
jgi:hypothetical protein